MAKRINWVKIRTDYCTNPKATHQSLSKKYKVADYSIAKKSSQEGWLKIRERVQQEVGRKVVDLAMVNIAEFQAKKLMAGLELAQKGHDAIMANEKIGAVAAKMVAELGWKLSSEALGVDKPGVVINNNQLTLVQILERVEEAQDHAWDD